MPGCHSALGEDPLRTLSLFSFRKAYVLSTRLLIVELILALRIFQNLLILIVPPRRQESPDFYLSSSPARATTCSASPLGRLTELARTAFVVCSFSSDSPPRTLISVSNNIHHVVQMRSIEGFIGTFCPFVLFTFYHLSVVGNLD